MKRENDFLECITYLFDETTTARRRRRFAVKVIITEGASSIPPMW